MSGIIVHGLGAVSPAGWGVAALRAAVKSGRPLAVKEIQRPGWERPLAIRAVPAPSPRPSFLAHPRLRRASAISQFILGAAVEALGGQVSDHQARKLAIILCVMNGCVGYSRRFFDETLRDPTTASPLVFPETVFNAPASHLGAWLGATGINYTLVGDPGTFGQGLALGAEWLERGIADGCLVIGAEEADWATADAAGILSRGMILSEGAGAIYLRREESTEGDSNPWTRGESGAGGETADEAGLSTPRVRLSGITEPRLFFDRATRASAAREMRIELPIGSPKELLCDGEQGLARMDAAEEKAWEGWAGARLSPKRVLGEGLMAAAAWQCVLAADWVGLGVYPSANVSLVGCNHLAIGACFEVQMDRGQR